MYQQHNFSEKNTFLFSQFLFLKGMYLIKKTFAGLRRLFINYCWFIIFSELAIKRGIIGFGNNEFCMCKIVHAKFYFVAQHINLL